MAPTRMYRANPIGPVLIIVHPGSACGSATFNLGASEARGARTTLAQAITAWYGHLLVIDGFLSTELTAPVYATLGDALRNTLARCKTSGFVALRRKGEDPTQDAVAVTFLHRHRFAPETTPILLTGAWYDPANREGCVNSVRNTLAQASYHTTIAPSAVAVAA